MSATASKKWFRMDNAALIFPAIMRKNWNNVFRLSVTLTDPVDAECLEKAVKDLMPRFPTFFVRLRSGFFWNYLEQIDTPIPVIQDYAYPLTHMSKRALKKSCVRILYYNNRIAAEFFHSVTDGTGGSVFLRNLTARYAELRYGVKIPAEKGIVDLSEKPRAEEICDGFLAASGPRAMSRAEENSFALRGKKLRDGIIKLTTGILPTDVLLEKAHSYGATVSVFLAAVMAESVAKFQDMTKNPKKRRAVKITIPVNLRRLFGINTLRNFVLTLNVGFDPRFGDFSLREICSQMSHALSLEAVPQKMAARIATNVDPQKNKLLRIMPLPVKTFAMRMVYTFTGERKGSLNVSNLGQTELPDELAKYVERMEFIIGVQYTYPNNCSVVSYGGKTYVNMIRNVESSELERLFFSRLVELGIPVSIESNERR